MKYDTIYWKNVGQDPINIFSLNEERVFIGSLKFPSRQKALSVQDSRERELIFRNVRFGTITPSLQN